MEKIQKISDSSRVIHTDSGNVYSVALDINESSWQDNFLNSKVSWENQPATASGKRIVSYGYNNDLPTIVRNIMDDNHLAPGILERKLGLLYGEGPQLYELIYEDGEITRKYQYNPEIWEWLKSWNLRHFLEKAIISYNYMKIVFVKKYINRGARIGKAARINSLKVVPTTHARFEYPESGFDIDDVKNILVGDFENNCYQTGIVTLPIWNKEDPFKNKVSMSFHNSFSFARNFYPVPAFYGTLKWIGRSSDIPEILKYLTENGITTAFHIHTPADYWEDKKEKLQIEFPDLPEPKILKKLDALKDATFENMTRVLAGKKNAGKFIETVDFYDVDGNLNVWKIEPIDQKIKDFIESQIKISSMANSAITSGIGLHPSLSNLVVDGQLSSGSQILYAIKTYILSETVIPEEVIFEPINEAIAVNFPGSKLKLGFYRKVMQKEDEVAPDERLKSKV